MEISVLANTIAHTHTHTHTHNQWMTCVHWLEGWKGPFHLVLPPDRVRGHIENHMNAKRAQESTSETEGETEA